MKKLFSVQSAKTALITRSATIATALLCLASIAAPLHARAQQPQDTTARNQALERLRARAPLISPDTVVADSLAPDSLAPPPPQLVEIQGDSAGAPRPGLLADDSIARQLLRLSGYVATEYSAPRARYDADSATLRLMGASAVTREGQVLNADSSIVFYEDTGFACGFGAPRLEGEGFDAPLASDSLCYDVDRRVGRAYGLSTSLTESATWYVRGQCWTVEDRLYCHDTMFTDCDVKEPHPHYHFRANDVKVVRGNVLVARDVTVNFADVPVFWLPVMMQSLARGRRTGILFPEFGIGDIARTSAGYNRRISNVGMFWAINDYMGLKVAGGWEANNHSNIELGYEYNVLRRFLRGGITVNRYWMDTGQRNLTFRTTNSWQPDERTNLSLSASYSSSTQLITERSYDPAELNRSIDSYANLNRRFDWGSVSLGGSRKQLLTDETVTWKLPGLSLSLPSVTLFEALPDEASWYNNVTWTGSGSFDYGRTDIEALNPDLRQSERGVTSSARHSLQLGRLGLSQNINFTSSHELGRAVPTTDTTVTDLPDSTRSALGWQTSLSFQQRLFAKTTITPSLSISGQTVARNEREVAEPMRMSVGASLGTDLYGFFPGFGPFERLRHRISPTFNYSYSPRPSVTDEQRDFFGIGELRESN
ncbi:MAG: putative LPS assembly protein LptD, partial [Longimicrobiales bacterium]